MHQTDGTTRYIALPQLPTGPATVDGRTIKAVGSEGSHVAALAASSTGQVFALVDNSYSAAAIELISGHQSVLSQYGFIQAAVVATNGFLYVLAYDPTKSSNDYALLTVDPSSLAIKTTVDTGINPAAANVYDLTLAVNQTTVFIYAAQADAYYQVPPVPFVSRSRLFELLPGTTSVKAVTLPDNLGLRMAVGSDGNAYIFDGPGKNQIASYNPNTGALRTMSEWTSPAGTYVRAVFA